MVYFGVMKMTSQPKWRHFPFFVYFFTLIVTDYSFFDVINVFNTLKQTPSSIKIMILKKCPCQIFCNLRSFITQDVFP
jgi:hypothetical protein